MTTEQIDRPEKQLAESARVVAVFARLTVSAIESMPAEVRRSVFEAIIEVLKEQARPYA